MGPWATGAPDRTPSSDPTANRAGIHQRKRAETTRDGVVNQATLISLGCPRRGMY